MDSSAHTHHHHMSLSTKLALGGAAITAGIIVAPYVLPALGISSGMAAEESLFLLHNETVGAGLAGTIGNALSAIPGIGSSLAQGGWFNIAATASTGIGGVLLGNWMSKNHKGKPGFDWGKAVKWAGLATSALIALPSILTGITNGIVFLASEFLPSVEATEIINQVAQTVGYTSYPDIFKSGLSGVAASLPHLLTCGSSIVPLVAGIGANEVTRPSDYVALDTKGNPLPADDKNHNISKTEQQLVDEYNNATPAKKIILKREILAQGYDPDFHADGTVHLHKHTHKPQGGMAMG